MKITALIENTSNKNDITTEHGLSLYIQTQKHKILFDMGQSNIFCDNAEKLNIKLEDIDIAILSHGHYDHGGGLKKFLEINTTAPVYIHEKSFNKHYSGKDKYIGLDMSIKNSDRIIFTNKNIKIDDELEILNCNNSIAKYPLSNENMNLLTENGMITDSFEHEQYLIITENCKKTVISGCSHKGIQNISDWLKPDCIVGGFHLKNTEMNSEGKEKLSEIAHNLFEKNITYYTCHCTGIEQYDFMKTIMKDKLFYLHCGDTFKI